jgi:hypothetical protein
MNHEDAWGSGCIDLRFLDLGFTHGAVLAAEFKFQTTRIIVSRDSDYRRGLDWSLDLLDT